MKKIIIGAFVALSFASWAYPQENADQGLQRYLFSPELLRRYQHELELTEDQQRYIVQQINQIQSEFTPLQWRLGDEMRKLTDLVENRASEEANILQQLDVVLSLEKDIKSQQLLLAVRIRNTLNDEQLRKLRNIRARTLRLQRALQNPDRGVNEIPR
jgi:Mg2+ and Co2+ transporter CorA